MWESTFLERNDITATFTVLCCFLKFLFKKLILKNKILIGDFEILLS